MKNLFIFGAVLLSVLTSCQKTVIVEVDHLPADSTITEVELENYIMRAYIALLNRTPDQAEHAAALSNLSVDVYDRSLRTSFITDLQATPRARWAAWQFLSNRLIEGEDTLAFAQSISFYESRINATSGGNKEYWQGLLDRTLIHKSAFDGWLANDTSYTRLLTTMMLLPVYDEINMGAENFVVSAYSHCYYRYPTDAELAAGVDMIDYQWASLYGLNGNSKSDFLAIISTQNEFFQGLILHVFEQYLNRDPETQEVVYYLNKLKSGWTYTDLQNNILTLTEYVDS